MTKEWWQNDEVFVTDLHHDYAIQAWLAHHLLGLGFTVRLPRLTVREHVSEAYRWRNEHDLYVEGKLVEVKSRNLSFTGPADFPYSDVIVDTRKRLNEKNPLPDAYVDISQQTMKMMWLPVADTVAQWVDEERFDNRRGFTDVMVLAPRGLWRSSKEFIEWLRKEANYEL